MLQIEISASVRTTTGKGAMRRLRQEGLTPAVVYGAGDAAMLLQIESKKLMAQLLEVHRRNSVATLKIDDGSEKHVMIGELQTDPILDTLVHVDFCALDIEKSRRYDVPVVLQGVAKGVDLGGELNVYSKSIVLEGKPLDIPNECTLDISGLNIGDELTFGDCAIPETVSMVSKGNAACVGVTKKM